MINVGLLTGHHYPRLGGMEFVNHFLADYLSRINGVKASVACGTMREVPKNFEYPYPCYRSKSFSYLTPWLNKRNEYNMIKREGINLLHGPMIHGGGYKAMQWSQKLRIPFVAQSHGSDVQKVPEIGYGEALNKENLSVIQKVMQQADGLVAVSTGNKQNMVELGADPNIITVVHNGVHFNEIQEIPFADYREKWGLKEEDFVLITVGRNRPVKRMELLFEAMKHLKTYKDIKCLCVGPEENLGNLSNTYGLKEKIVLTGRIPQNSSTLLNPPYEELINAYRAANAYISTSYVESFGSATADALACGLPVIIGKKHGVKDIIQENSTGWIMEKETPEELAEMILDLYKRREKLKQQAEMIKQSVSWLTWGYVASEMVEVYKNVLR